MTLSTMINLIISIVVSINEICKLKNLNKEEKLELMETLIGEHILKVPLYKDKVGHGNPPPLIARNLLLPHLFLYS